MRLDIAGPILLMPMITTTLGFIFGAMEKGRCTDTFIIIGG